MGTESHHIPVGRVLLRIATGDTAARDSGLKDATTARLIDQVSAWAGEKYNQDRDDIRQALALLILKRIHAIKNPPSAASWLYSEARNYCFDSIRNRRGQIFAAEVGQPSLQTGEEALLERAETDAKLMRLRHVISQFPSDIVDSWASGKSAREIAEETGRSISTVYRILKRLQQAVYHEFIRDLSGPDSEHLQRERVPSSQDISHTFTPANSQRSRSGRFVGLRRKRQTAQVRPSSEQILSEMGQLDSSELEKLVPKVIALGAARKARHLKPTESKLLARANEALPQDLKSRLSKLQKKRDKRSLTKTESEELIALSDRVEQLHAERLEALADLARLRGKTLTELMDQLGIRFPANA